MNKTINILFLLVWVVAPVFGQTSPYLVQSRLNIQSVDNYNKPFEASTDGAYMVLYTSTGDFVLNADVANLRTGDAKMDSILASKGPQLISFKGNLSQNLFLFSQPNNEEKSYNLPGKLLIGSLSIDCIAEYDPINYGDKTDPKNYRIDFELMLSEPVKGIIPGLENKISKRLYFEVRAGNLNIQP